jgi:ureidoacrylate peracid hydrolase
MSSVSVSARPERFTFIPGKTAVIVVDMQNDFGSPGGMFDRAGIDISQIQAIVPAIARVLDAARSAGSRVIYLKMEFRPDLSDLGGADSPNAVKQPLGVGSEVTGPGGLNGRILIEGTWNTEIVSELAPTPNDIVVSKHRYSGFFGTDLDVILKGLGIDTLVFTGATTSVCVDSTLRDAMFRDYRCLLLEDCTAEPIAADAPRSNHEATLLVTEILLGWVSDSASFVAALET